MLVDVYKRKRTQSLTENLQGELPPTSVSMVTLYYTLNVIVVFYDFVLTSFFTLRYVVTCERACFVLGPVI